MAKNKFFVTNMETLENADLMAPSSQSEMRQAAERNVLTYILVLIYEQDPKKLILERGLTFAPLVARIFKNVDPAALSKCISVDFDNEDNSPLNANFLAIVSGKLLKIISLVLLLKSK